MGGGLKEYLQACLAINQTAEDEEVDCDYDGGGNKYGSKALRTE